MSFMTASSLFGDRLIAADALAASGVGITALVANVAAGRRF